MNDVIYIEEMTDCGFSIINLFYYDINESGNFLNESLKEVYAKLIHSHMGGNYGLADEYIYVKPLSQGLYEVGKVLYYGDQSARLTVKGTYTKSEVMTRICGYGKAD